MGVLPPALLAGGVAASARVSLGFTALKGGVAAWYVSHAAMNVCSAPPSAAVMAATGWGVSWGVHARASRAARMGPGDATGVPAASVHGLGQDAASTALASALAVALAVALASALAVAWAASAAAAAAHMASRVKVPSARLAISAVSFAYFLPFQWQMSSMRRGHISCPVVVQRTFPFGSHS